MLIAQMWSHNLIFLMSITTKQFNTTNLNKFIDNICEKFDIDLCTSSNREAAKIYSGQ